MLSKSCFTLTMKTFCSINLSKENWGTGLASSDGRTQLKSFSTLPSGYIQGLNFQVTDTVSHWFAVKTFTSFCLFACLSAWSSNSKKTRNASASYIPGGMGENQDIRGARRRSKKKLFATLQIHFRAFPLLQHLLYVWYVSWNGGTNSHRLFNIVFWKYWHNRCPGLASVYTVHVSLSGRHCLWFYRRQVMQVYLFLS